MYHRFEKLRKHGDKLELRAFIQHLNTEELMQLVHSSIYRVEATKILNDLLQPLSDSDACQLKRRQLIESILKSSEKAKISTGQTNAIINRIISELPKCSKQHLVKLVDFCLTNICNNDNELHSWKDLLPVLLETLEDEKYVFYADAEVSGTEYKSLIVKAICNYQWNVSLLPSLAKLFGDMALDKIASTEVLKTLCSVLPSLPLDQVPAFTYQALKLCKDKDNQILLGTLSKYFESCYLKAVSIDDKGSLEDIDIINKKEVQDTESTVLYHVYQAAQLNHENMRDFIRFVKHVSHTPEYVLQPFILAVLMSVSGIYEDQIFEILKMAIVNSSLENRKRQSSAWLRQLLPSSRTIIEIIQQVINSSNKDRHLVLRGLTSLAFTLMNVEQKFKNDATAMWHIGSEIIREIIKNRHEIVPVVLQELINKIVVGSTPTTHYTDCLKYMCRELSIIVLDHQVLIMTILERLLFLPNMVASRVLNAIFPLVHVSPNIRENLLLILRKALYRKGTLKRQLAVTGFLEILKYSKMHSLGSFRLSQHCSSSGYTATSSSQSILTQVTLECNSQQEKSITECDKTLCYEILDILKKSFAYEFEITSLTHFFITLSALYSTVIKTPDITEILLDMMFSHLNLYFNTDDSILPPIKLELCTNICEKDVILQEPIAQLIFALQKIYNSTVARELNVFKKLHDTLESLCRRMIVTELEHLNLEQGTDLSHEDFLKSKTKLKNLSISIEIYEALMAFQIGQWLKGNKDSLNKINNLFKGYTRFMDFIKMQCSKVKTVDGGRAKKDNNVSNTSKKINKSTNIIIPTTIMDLDVIYQSLSLLFSQSLTQNDFGLRKNRNFCCYILQTCEQFVRRIGSLMNDTSQMQNHYLNTYIRIGGLLYKCFILNSNDALLDDEQVTILVLQCFKEISCSICTLFSSELLTFLNSMCKVQSKKDLKLVDTNSQLEEIIFSLKPYLEKSLVEETDNEERTKISFLLLQIMEQFTYKINFENYDSNQLLECIKSMIGLENIQSSIASEIVKFLLNLEERAQEYGETLNEICVELCDKVGSIDSTESVTNRQYKIIHEDSVLQIYNVLNSHIKEKLDNVYWLLKRLKAENAISRVPGTVDEVWNNNLREKERNLCKQLSFLAQVLYTLANTSIKPGPRTDATFRNLQFFYHLLAILTRYFYAKSSSQNVAFQAAKFIQVVQLAGKPLKTAFYNMVTYVEENQTKTHSKFDSCVQRNKILKETKVIPRVVYEIEQFNKEILLLGKKTDIPLENYLKHSITRDFRIKNPQLVEGLEKMDVSMLTPSNPETSENEIHNSNMNEADRNSDDESIRKRRRTEN